MDALKSLFGLGKKAANTNYKPNSRVVNNFAKNNTKKNNNRSPVVWNGKVLPPATPAGQKSNINSNWKPAATKNSRRKTRRSRK
jgi:hypothetical protein